MHVLFLGGGGKCKFFHQSEICAKTFFQSEKDPITMIAENLGGSGHNSKMNARIIYVPVMTHRELDNPLNLSAFEDFQSYFIDHLQNRILQDNPVSTTAMQCNSCVTIEGRPVFVHETQSESMEFEEKKVIFYKAC